MDKKITITLKSVFYAIFIIAVTIICVGGISPYPLNARFPLIVIVAVMTAAYIIFKQQKICITLPTALMILSVAYIFISVFYSIDSKTTMNFAITYLLSTIILLADYPTDLLKKTLTAIKIVCIIIAISIILSAFVDDFMLKYFSFFMNPRNYTAITDAIHQEIYWMKAYSGFAREKGEAAYIMNVGIAIYYAKYFSEKKFKISDLIMLALLFGALILTGKRMLFICPIAVAAALMLFSNKKGRFVKALPVILLAVCGVIVLAATLPQFSNLFERFSDKNTVEKLSGRVELWPFCFDMFHDSPLFGLGMGSFNKYTYIKGFRFEGEKWGAYGHNVYYELLGELGIIGSILIFGALIAVFAKTILLMRNKNITSLEKYLLTFSFAIQLTLFIYCASGNVLLYSQQTYMWLFADAITMSISRKYYTVRKRRNELAYV